MCTTIVPVYKVEVYYRKSSRVYPVVLSIIFSRRLPMGASMAVRVSHPIKFDGWARDNIASRLNSFIYPPYPQIKVQVVGRTTK
jgi:hypothetical protein